MCAERSVPPHTPIEPTEPQVLSFGLTMPAGESRHIWASPPEVWDVISPRAGGPYKMYFFEFPLPTWPMGWGRSSLHAVELEGTGSMLASSPGAVEVAQGGVGTSVS